MCIILKVSLKVFLIENSKCFLPKICQKFSPGYTDIQVEECLKKIEKVGSHFILDP